MKKTKTILLFTFLLILIASITHAALLNKYASITGYVIILPSDDPNTPPDRFACMNEGYLNYTNLQGETFSNQGECISYVATEMCKDNGWTILTKEDGSSFDSQGQCVSYFKNSDNSNRGNNNELNINNADVFENNTENITNNITTNITNNNTTNNTNNITTSLIGTFEEGEEDEEGDLNE